MKIKLLFIFLLIMQCKIFAQTISKQNLEIVCKEQHCSIQKADSILRNCGYIHFDTTTYDFGNVIEGKQAKHSFSFTNIGNKPLLLTNVRCPCGCLTDVWNTGEIVPSGNSSKVELFYSTQGRIGKFVGGNCQGNANSYNSTFHLQVTGIVVALTTQKK